MLADQVFGESSIDRRIEVLDYSFQASTETLTSETG